MTADRRAVAVATRTLSIIASIAGPIPALIVGLGAASGCGTVLGIDDWDVEPGAGGGNVTSTASTAGGPSSSAGTGGAGDGGGGDGGGNEGGAGGGGSTVTTAGGGGEGGCGIPDTSEHCGTCNRSCWGGPCNPGGLCGPVQLAGISAQTDRLAVGGDHLVFLDSASALRRVRKSAPGSVDVLGGVPGAVTSVTIADVGGQLAAFYSSDGRITRHLLDVADPTPLSPLEDERFFPGGLQAVAGFLYWFDGTTSEQQGIYRSSWNAAGAPSLHCAGSGTSDLAMIGQGAYFVRTVSTTRQLLTCSGSSSSSFVSEAGHIPNLVETDPAAQMVYYTTFANQDAQVPAAIWRKPAAGGPSEMMIAPEVSDWVLAFTHGGLHLYWRTSPGELLAFPKAGGAIERVATGLVNAVAADAEGVYWSNQAGVWAMRRD